MKTKKLNSLNKHQEAIYDDLRFLLKSTQNQGAIIMLDKLVDSITDTHNDVVARLEAMMDERREGGNVLAPPDMYENTQEENDFWRSGYIQGVEDSLFFLA